MCNVLTLPESFIAVSVGSVQSEDVANTASSIIAQSASCSLPTTHSALSRAWVIIIIPLANNSKKSDGT